MRGVAPHDSRALVAHVEGGGRGARRADDEGGRHPASSPCGDLAWTAWTPASATSRPTTPRVLAGGRSPGSSRSTATRRSTSPSTRTSRRAGRRRTPGGGELPRKYPHTYDLFVALTAAAAATSHLRVGSGIRLVVERDPITTAKEVASVDHLSGGRLEFGVGAGWNREEMANHGTDPRTRMKLLAERVEAMKAIWTQDEASYHGRFVDFDRIWSWPKPAQRPHPPVLVGGNGRRCSTAPRRSATRGSRTSPAATCSSASRRPASAASAVVVMGVPADVRALEQLREAGVERVIRWVPSAAALADRGRARALRGRRRGAQRRGMTARERFASARVARLATTGRTGRTWCRSCSPSPATRSTTRSTTSPSAPPRSSGSRTCAPTRARPCSPTPTTRTGPGSGGRARTAPPASSSPATPRRWRCSPSATRSTASTRRRAGRRDRRHPLVRLDRERWITRLRPSYPPLACAGAARRPGGRAAS